MKKLLVAFWNWLVISSKNPQKIAMTVKGGIVMAIPVILWATGALHFTTVDSNGLQSLATDIGDVTGNLAGMFGIGMATWGLIRKIWITLRAFFAKEE